MKNSLKIALVVGCVAVVLGLGYKVNAARSYRDEITSKAADKLVQELKNSGELSLSIPEVPEKGVGGGLVNAGERLFPDGLSLGDQTEFWKTGVMASGTNQASWQNTFSKRVYVSYGEIEPFGGTPSSSYRFFMTTSTASSLGSAYEYASNPFSNLIDNYLFVTSSKLTIVVNSFKDAGTNGRHVIPVEPNEYVNILVRQESLVACPRSGADYCESATSTARGPNFKWRFKVHRDPTYY